MGKGIPGTSLQLPPDLFDWRVAFRQGCRVMGESIKGGIFHSREGGRLSTASVFSVGSF